MILRPLDLIFEKGHGPISLFIRLLTSIRYGIPLKDCLSHVCLGYNKSLTISAEAKGTILIPFEKSQKKSDIIIYRFRDLQAHTVLEFYDLCREMVGRPYAYARYALDAARIFSFCFALTGLILSLFNWRVNVGMFAAVGVLQLLTVWLRKQDVQTSDCAEMTSIFLSRLELMATLPKTRNEFSNSIESKLETLCLYNLADKVGTWNHKTQIWEN